MEIHLPLESAPPVVCLAGVVRERPAAPIANTTAEPRLLDRVRAAIRVRHYSRRTEKAYVGWIRRFILFHGKRHPDGMAADEITRFLSHLAVEGKVSASTQNQALSALLFFYRDVLGRELAGMDELGVRDARCGFRWCWITVRWQRCCASCRAWSA